MDFTKALSLAYRIAFTSQDHFVNKRQDEVERFIYCALEKAAKVILGIRKFYAELGDLPDLEFSIGILCRSLLMDMILATELKGIFNKFDGSNLEEIRAELRRTCLVLISDSTQQLLDAVLTDSSLTPEQKEEAIQRLAGQFPDVFTTEQGKLKRKKTYEVPKLKSILLKWENSSVSVKDVYTCYSFYSRYDHLSHWTSQAGKLPIEHRKGKIELCILFMLLHLRDLLALAYDYNDQYEVLEGSIRDLQRFIMEEEEGRDPIPVL